MKVEIKTWSEMAREFGEDYKGDIDCQYMFTEEMENFLPLNRVIHIHEEDCVDGYFLERVCDQ